MKTFWKEFIPKSWICLRKKYTWDFFKGDLVAGLTVGIMSLPLAMAFAIASGLSPISGIYTSIIAGFIIALFGGSTVQIGGPTGAFVVIIFSIVQRHGYEGLVLATLMAGGILLLSALARLGRFLKFIPYPLITGFTTGLAVLIFSSQIKEFFGLQIPHLPTGFIEKWAAYFSALPTLQPLTLSIAVGTLGLIIFIRRFFPKLPWGITAIAITTLISWGFHLPLSTIQTCFGEIPRTLPFPGLPSLPLSNWFALLPDAFTIAFLAGVEALLSAVVADGMTGKRHKSNCELMANGLANIGSVFFGGIPATGAFARTAVNIKSGAKTPLAGIIHALTLFLIILAFAPIVSQIPMAALSAVLVMVAWNMSELHHFRHLFKASFSDVAILLTAFFFTVLADLVVAIEVGMILSAFLFMKRMSDHSGVTILSKEKNTDPDTIEEHRIPPGVNIYEMRGLFHCGLGDNLKTVFSSLEHPPKVFILRMRSVPTIDASGMHALRQFYHNCQQAKTIPLLSGVNSKVYRSLEKFGLIALIGKEHVFPHIDPSLDKAAHLVKESLS